MRPDDAGERVVGISQEASGLVAQGLLLALGAPGVGADAADAGRGSGCLRGHTKNKSWMRCQLSSV